MGMPPMNSLKFYIFVIFFLSTETFACSINAALSSGVGESVDVSVGHVYFYGGESVLTLNFVDKKTQSLMAYLHNRRNITSYDEFFDAICDASIKLSCAKKRFGSVDFIEVTDKASKHTFVPSFRDGILIGYVMRTTSIDYSADCNENYHEHVFTALDIFFKTGDIVDVTKFLESNGNYNPSQQQP